MDPSTDGMETRRTVTLPQVVRILWTCPLPWSSLVEGCIGPIGKLLCLFIEHCIIGETFFFASSPILGAFYNNEKNMLFIDIEQAISQ